MDQCSAQFLKHIEKGKTIASAAALSGLAESTVFGWLADGRKNQSDEFVEFLESFTRARGKAQDKLVTEIREAGRQDWRALCWLAERMFPEQFNLRQFEPAVSVNVNATATASQPAETHTQMRERMFRASQFADAWLKEQNNGNGQ